MSTNSTTAGLDPEFVISRTFEAPRELVWKAWTEADRMQRWWGPKGFAIEIKAFEPRPGGIFHYVMRNPAGFVMWGRFVYWELVRPERIVFVSGFSDETGGQTRAPFFDGKWPLDVLNIVDFTDEGGRTTMTLTARPLDAMDVEIATFASNLPSLRQGYGGTFDQLVEELAR